jgi:hypothetical protein
MTVRDGVIMRPTASRTLRDGASGGCIHSNLTCVVSGDHVGGGGLDCEVAGTQGGLYTSGSWDAPLSSASRSIPTGSRGKGPRLHPLSAPQPGVLPVPTARGHRRPDAEGTFVEASTRDPPCRGTQRCTTSTSIRVPCGNCQDEHQQVAGPPTDSHSDWDGADLGCSGRQGGGDGSPPSPVTAGRRPRAPRTRPIGVRRPREEGRDDWRDLHTRLRDRPQDGLRPDGRGPGGGICRGPGGARPHLLIPHPVRPCACPSSRCVASCAASTRRASANGPDARTPRWDCRPRLTRSRRSADLLARQIGSPIAPGCTAVATTNQCLAEATVVLSQSVISHIQFGQCQSRRSRTGEPVGGRCRRPARLRGREG